MIIKWEAVRQRHLSRLIIDLFMLVVAIANLSLILFDTTYLAFRDTYFRYLPALTQRYDLLKGIEPHRDTEAYLSQAQALFDNFSRWPPAQRLSAQSALTDASRRMIENDPFQRAGKTGHLELIKERIRHEMHQADSSKKAFADFWQLTPDNVAARRAYFDHEIKPLLEVNFWRRIGTNGQYVDHFFYLDLAFVLVFAVEFLIMWGIAIRRHGPDQRVIFPLYRWYDVLGLLPLPQFRFLRLFRVYAIYRRLVQSDLVTIGEGPIHRLMNRWKDILSEELSDQVAVKILTDAQDDIRHGVHKAVLEETIRAHKAELKQSLLQSVRKMEERVLVAKHDEWVAFLAEIVEKSIKDSDEYRRLAKVPFVSFQLNDMVSRERVSRLVDQSLTNVSRGIYHALYTQAGEAFMDGLLDDVLEEVIAISKDGMMEDLLQRINIKLLDEFKRSTQVKKWAQKGGVSGA